MCFNDNPLQVRVPRYEPSLAVDVKNHKEVDVNSRVRVSLVAGLALADRLVLHHGAVTVVLTSDGAQVNALAYTTLVIAAVGVH